MTETKSCHEPALPAKRKSDLTSQDHDPLPHKSPKLQTQDETIQPSQEDHAFHPSGNINSSVSEPRPEKEENGSTPVDQDPEIDSGEGEEDEDEDYEDEDEEDEENGSTPVDRKGKGVLIEEENDSDDDNDNDSSDGGIESEGESDLSDDPLAEVDLDNILPSRTRRRVVRPGVHIAKEVGNKGETGDSDDSDS